MPKRYAFEKEITGPNGVAPEFGSIASGRVQTWMRIAQSMIGLERFGECASDAHALLTAHFLETQVGVDGLGGSEVGPLVSEAHGPASRSFAAPGVTDSELSTSSYGKAFTILRRKIRGRGRAVVMNTCPRQVE